MPPHYSERTPSFGAGEGGYREARPHPAAIGQYTTVLPQQNYQTRAPQQNTYETFRPRNDPAFAERVPLPTPYAVRQPLQQYEARTPAGAGPVKNARPVEHDYAVKTPTDVFPPGAWHPKPVVKRTAYVESVANSDDDTRAVSSSESASDHAPRRKHSSARTGHLGKSRSPLSPSFDHTVSVHPTTQFPVAHQVEKPTPLRRPNSISASTPEARPTLSPLQSQQGPPTSGGSFRQTRHASLQGVSPKLPLEYTVVTPTLPSFLQSIPERPRSRSPLHPPPPPPPTDSAYREVQPLERRRSSAHRKSSTTHSPRSPALPEAPMPPPRRDSYGFSAAFVEVEEPAFLKPGARQLSGHAATDPKSPRSETSTSSKARSVAFEEAKPRLSSRRPSDHGKRRTSSNNLPPRSPSAQAFRGTYRTPSAVDDDSDDGIVRPPLSPTMSAATTTSDTSSRLSRTRSTRSKSLTSNSTPTSTSTDAHHAKPKHAMFYDASIDANTVLLSLNHLTGAQMGALVDILPRLTHDQLLDMRAEYKRLYRVAGHGVSISKHIRLRLPLSSPTPHTLYTLSLGPHGASAYNTSLWALPTHPQIGALSYTLLIESLLCTSNHNLLATKTAFLDQKHGAGDSLPHIVEKTLRSRKTDREFRHAVMAALEARRMEETESVKGEVVQRDVVALRRTVNAQTQAQDEGDGGSASGDAVIMDIVLGRSEGHMRDVLRAYERAYGPGFVSNVVKGAGSDVVADLFTYALGTIINKPAHDAAALSRALIALSPTYAPLPYPTYNEAPVAQWAAQQQHNIHILTSRLIRLHWDKPHLARVRAEYARRSQVQAGEGIGEGALETDIRFYCSGVGDEEFAELCVRLVS